MCSRSCGTAAGRIKLIERWRDHAEKLEQETYAIYLAYRDPRVPWYARIWAALVVAYALSPIDLIPDFIPVLGYLDDLILVPLGIALALKMIPAEVLAECRAKTRATWEERRPSRGAAIVITIWLLLAATALLLILRAIR